MGKGNRMDRYDPYTDKFLRDTQYNILGTNLASLGTDCISRQAAIDRILATGYADQIKDKLDEEGLSRLEELNSDYINEHFGDLQDTAYQKGFEDGKAVNDKSCEGCKYAGKVVTGQPCISCCNSYKNQWTAKDDKIEVGDEVAFHHDGRPDTVVVVTYIGQDGFIDGMDGRGIQYAHKNPAKWTKTGRHFDIASILEDMRK